MLWTLDQPSQHVYRSGKQQPLELPQPTSCKHTLSGLLREHMGAGGGAGRASGGGGEGVQAFDAKLRGGEGGAQLSLVAKAFYRLGC